MTVGAAPEPMLCTIVPTGIDLGVVVSTTAILVVIPFPVEATVTTLPFTVVAVVVVVVR